MESQHLESLARRGGEYVPLPEGSGKLLAATVFHGMLLISCEGGLYVRSAALQVWEKIELKEDGV